MLWFQLHSPNGKGIGGLHHVWKLLEWWVIEWDISKLICQVLGGHGLAWLPPSYDFSMIEPLVFDPSIEEIIWVTGKKNKFGAFRYGFPSKSTLDSDRWWCFDVQCRHSRNQIEWQGEKAYHQYRLYIFIIFHPSFSKCGRCFLANLPGLKGVFKFQLDHLGGFHEPTHTYIGAGFIF